MTVHARSGSVCFNLVRTWDSRRVRLYLLNYSDDTARDVDVVLRQAPCVKAFRWYTPGAGPAAVPGTPTPGAISLALRSSTNWAWWRSISSKCARLPRGACRCLRDRQAWPSGRSGQAIPQASTGTIIASIHLRKGGDHDALHFSLYGHLDARLCPEPLVPIGKAPWTWASSFYGLPADWPLGDYRHAPAEAVERWKDWKFGIRIHWGYYSMIGGWCGQTVNCIPGMDGYPTTYHLGHCDDRPQAWSAFYSTLYQYFNPVQFNADQWMDLFARSGIRYFTFTAKHIDGFCMWPTEVKRRVKCQVEGMGCFGEAEISYSIADTPYGQDIVGQLVAAARRRQMGVGLYYNHMDWTDPAYAWDKFNMHFDPQFTKQSDPRAVAEIHPAGAPAAPGVDDPLRPARRLVLRLQVAQGRLERDGRRGADGPPQSAQRDDAQPGHRPLRRL